MKKITQIFSLVFLFVGAVSTSYGQAQKVQLVQTPGQFETESLMLTAGDYQFEIVNEGVNHEVGFVLAPKGKTDQPNHIKEAYVKAPVKDGTSSMTNVVSLAPGEYVFFCPLNPTKEYNLTVKSVENIRLEQMTGKFTTESLMLSAGDYQFEIANNGVDHEVGFVLAPKGKTDQPNHIKEAYVKAPVKDGSSSMTNIVSLTPGEYVFFRPLNPTKEYPLTVKEVENIRLEQMTGKFTTENLMLDAGDYQFEIVNNGVDHEVGFVLAPKGKTDQPNHIKEAYVKAPVKDGSSSKTNIVTLTPGQYVYFCPLNPTKEYNLTVK